MLSGYVRRVIGHHQGRLHYETRAQVRKGARWAWQPGIVDQKTFALMVERLVPCDWTVESDEDADPVSQTGDET
jgi:hypothetical protein